MERQFKKEQLKGAVIRYGNYTIRIGEKVPETHLTYFYTVI